jgi:hypothetical protein
VDMHRLDCNPLNGNALRGILLYYSTLSNARQFTCQRESAASQIGLKMQHTLLRAFVILLCLIPDDVTRKESGGQFNSITRLPNIPISTLSNARQFYSSRMKLDCSAKWFRQCYAIVIRNLFP